MSVLDWFLEPADARARGSVSGVLPAPEPGVGEPASGAVAAAVLTAAVLGPPAAVEPVAAAVAAMLRRRSRAGAAIVAVLAPGAGPAMGAPQEEAPPDGRASPSRGEVASGLRESARGPARRLAERLASRGHAAVPRGRLVRVALPAHGAVAAAHRTASTGAPVVLALAAARTPELDALLAVQDLLLLVTADAAAPLAAVALEELGRLGPRVVAVPPLPAGPIAALARAGLLPGRLGSVLHAPAPPASGPS